MKGIQRLEDCIRRIDRHNELLKEKYGVDCESAGARPDLAYPSTDPHRASTNDDHHDSKVVGNGTKEVGSRSSSSVAEGRKDDLERKIFDQLMNVANSVRRSSNGLLEISSDGTKFPDQSAPRATKESFHGELRGNLSLEEALADDRKDFATYEITGNLSVCGRAPRFTDRNSDLDYYNSLDEDDLLRRSRTFDRPPRSRDRAIFFDDDDYDDEDAFSSASNYDSTSKRETRTSESWENARRGNCTPVQGWKRCRETDDYPRCRMREGGCTRGSRDIEAGVEIMPCECKLRYPASPRARFLELLRERRRIVECSRGACAS